MIKYDRNQISTDRRFIFLKKWSTFIFTFFAALLFLFPGFNHKVSATTLNDIPAGSSSEISYLLDKGVIKGYPGNLFLPNQYVTRDEAATMIGRALGLDGTQRATIFPDVGKDSYASGYIQSAVEKNIIGGYSDGRFGPKDKITRGHMAFLLQRAFNLTEGSNITFIDVPKSSAEYTAIDQITTAGLSNGYADGSFKPALPVTREQFSLFVARGLNKDFRVSFLGQPIKEASVNVESWDVLNVRSGPSSDYAKVGSLKAGTKVSVYRYEGDWAYISSGSIIGYVNSYYLSTPTKGHVIAIDPGHGGSDPGAIGIGGMLEKELNLSVGLKVESLLKNMGIEVVMTRRTDTYPTLTERVNIAVNGKADAFLSIHGNKFNAESANGTETYYSTASVRSEDSKQLATFVQNRLYPALGTTNRGVKTANYTVIYSTPLPSALVELGFISNTSDASKLASDTYRNKAAEAIALGIQDYYNWKK